MLSKKDILERMWYEVHFFISPEKKWYVQGKDLYKWIESHVIPEGWEKAKKRAWYILNDQSGKTMCDDALCDLSIHICWPSELSDIDGNDKRSKWQQLYYDML